MTQITTTLVLALMLTGCAKQTNTVNIGDVNLSADVPDQISILLDVPYIAEYNGLLVVRYLIETENAIEEICKLVDIHQLSELIDIRDAESYGECVT